MVLTGDGYESGCYVKPAIAEANNNYKIVQHETFAPAEVSNAIEIHCNRQII